MKKSLLILKDKIKSDSSNLEGLTYDYYVHLCKNNNLTPVNMSEFGHLVDLNKKRKEAFENMYITREKIENVEATIRRIENNEHNEYEANEEHQRNEDLTKAKKFFQRYRERHDNYENEYIRLDADCERLARGTNDNIRRAMGKVKEDKRIGKREI
jgi:predicted RNase H-like nuclease (RuvC/YqgF family)